MKRGPYKLYLGPDGDGVMPRSTFYDKIKKVRCADTTANKGNQLYNQTVDDHDTNATNLLPHVEISEDNNLSSVENVDEIIASPIYDQSSTTIHTVPDSWIYGDYDTETLNREIWFDAEDSPSAEDFCMGSNNKFNQKTSGSEESDTYCYNQPLCQCTSVTRGEAMMMTLMLGAQESLTWKAITGILSMINTLFGSNVVPASKFKLFQILEMNNNNFSNHLYCNECFYYFGVRSTLNSNEFVCQNCEKHYTLSNISYFLTLDFASQLKKILESSEVQEVLLNLIENEEEEEENSIKNITDGHIYKKLSTPGPNNPLCNKYNFSYTFNTDGCQAAKSSNLSIWPIYVTINELPPKLKSKHLIMTGLWVDKVEPDMNLFLKSFVDEANDLSNKGLKWKLGEQTITSKFVPLCACVDSVARCKMLNMKQYNGRYGCTFCEHPTETVNKCCKFTMLMKVPVKRTDKSIKDQMVLASENEYRQDVTGVWGPSQLMNLKYFDLVDGMSPDYLHSILLGTVKQHTELLLSSFGEEYYAGSPNQLEAINRILLTFKHPTSITRSPRDIIERNKWKASEWRSWLLFYSLLCLSQIIPHQYLDHLALLVEAVTILLEDKITIEMLQTADGLLIRYVSYYQEYFGSEHMTYNVHLLLHMVNSVANLGPLWAHNTFCFENENHFILKMKKSPSHVGLQIARRYFFQKSLPAFSERFILSDAFHKFCERNLTGRLKNIFKIDDCILIGNGKKYNLNDSEKKAIDFTPVKCKSYNRLIYDGNRYTSKSYRLCQKIDDTIIMLKDDKKGMISNICCFEDKNGNEEIKIFYQEIKHTGKFFHSTRHVIVHSINECLITNDLYVCKPNSIMRPGILKKIGTKYHIINIPKGCYGD